MQISVITTKEKWLGLKPQWNPLLQASGSSACFLTFEWLMAWAECFLFPSFPSGRLHILTFHEKDRLIGIAPFCLLVQKRGPIKYRMLQFIGAPQAGSDYLDVIAQKGREKEVATALYDYLVSRRFWDILSLHDIPSGSLFLLHFFNCIERGGKYAEMKPSAYCPAVSIHNGFDEYFAGLSKNRKKKFKQDLRVIHRDHKVEHKIADGNDAALNLPRFFRFYTKTSNRGGESLQNMLQRYAAQCSPDIPFQIDFLEVNGRPVSGLLHLKHNTALAMYIMAVDKNFDARLSMGNLIVGMCIENAYHNGYRTYDFLKGDEAYKFHWANNGTKTLALMFWNKRSAGIAFALTDLIKNAGKLLLP